MQIIKAPSGAGIEIWTSGGSFKKDEFCFFEDDESFYISLVDNNSGNQPDTSPTKWKIVPDGIADAHTQGTDQKLDKGGANEVAVADVADAVDKKDKQQCVTVAKAGGDYTTIQAAITAITDATSSKPYTVLVYPGLYDEAITLKDYVDIIAVDPDNTKVLQQITDNNVECHCNLDIAIDVSTAYGVYLQNASSVLNVKSMVKSSYNNAAGHAITVAGGTLICQNGKIICTHADAKAVFASSAQDVKLMNVWSNRDLHANITNLITGGFNVDSDVE
jgi:hypothetical protein